MRQTCPLPENHPEFTIHDWPGFTEYRVENWRLARDGTRRILRGTRVWSWVDVVVVALVVVALAVFWTPGSTTIIVPVSRPVFTATISIAVISLVWARCTQILHESLLVFSIGIQLETHRGHPLLPVTFRSVTRRFIPLDALEDVIIHEGFRRWDVRFYLAALHRRGGYPRGDMATAPRDQNAMSQGSETHASHPARGSIQVVVAFENLLPHFPVLKVVYLGVQEALFPLPTRMDIDGSVDPGLAPDYVPKG